MRSLALLAVFVVTIAAAKSSHVAWGFNFDELRYMSGSKVIQFHHGQFDDPSGDLPSSRSIEGVFPGILSGQHVAVVLERGEGPGGYDESATLYLIANGKATSLKTIGDLSFFQTGEGPWPHDDTWYAFRFSGDRLYADVWNYETRCHRAGDWIVTTYRLRGDQLVAVNKLSHHRAGAPLPKPYKNGDAISCTY